MKYKEKTHDLGFIEAAPKPTQEELNKFYEKQYYQNTHGNYEKNYPDQELEYFKNNALLKSVSALKINNNLRKIIDIGCGEGFTASYFLSIGWEVIANDYSDHGIKKFNSHLLSNFQKCDINSFIDSLNLRDEPALINLSHVLEHVVHPIDTLNKINSIMNEGSVICCNVPNDYSGLQELLVKENKTKNTWFNPPEHLSYFNNSNIEDLFEHCGFKVVSMEGDFPIEIFIANSHSNYAMDRSLGKEAHANRILLTNYLINKDIDAYIEYSKAAIKLGLGRNLTIYARKKTS